MLLYQLLGLCLIINFASGVTSMLPVFHRQRLDRLIDDYISANSNISTESYSPSTKYIFINLKAGWGNRLPPIVTALSIALFSQRRLIVTAEEDLREVLHFRIPCLTLSKWYEHIESRLLFTWGGDQAALLTLNFTDPLLTQVPVWRFHDVDYKVPLLQLNPSIEAFFEHYFPSWEVFHDLSTRFLRPAAAVQRDVDAALAHFGSRYLICMQMRTVKSAVVPEVFHSLALGLAKKHTHAMFFILSDSPAMYTKAAEALGKERVYWTDNGVASGSTAGEATNPGTFHSGLVDLYAMARCQALITTRSSSFGYTGAALANVPAIQVYGAEKAAETAQVWFFKSITSEPCYFDYNRLYSTGDQKLIALFKTHPWWLHFLQCHPPN